MYKCEQDKCDNFNLEVSVPKTTYKFVDGEMVSPETKCGFCGEYMVEVPTEFTGFSTNARGSHSEGFGRGAETKRRQAKARTTDPFTKKRNDEQ